MPINIDNDAPGCYFRAEQSSRVADDCLRQPSSMTGRQLAHYLVGEKLGEGGMGIVYRGTDTRLKRPVALKFLTRALPFDAQERKRFLREARAASAIIPMSASFTRSRRSRGKSLSSWSSWRG
jgi:serine/threonine protein kinase